MTRPLNGADSAAAYVLRPYRVLMCGRFDEDDRHWVDVPAALGPHDAMNQAREEHPGRSPLKAVELLDRDTVPALATVDEIVEWAKQ